MSACRGPSCVVVGLGTIAIKAAGPVLLGGRPLPARLGASIALLGARAARRPGRHQHFGGDRELVHRRPAARRARRRRRDRAARRPSSWSSSWPPP